MSHQHFLIFIQADGELKVLTADKPMTHPELICTYSFKRDSQVYHLGFVGAKVNAKAALTFMLGMFEAFEGVGSELALN